MSTEERVRAVVTPLVEAEGVELIDIEHTGPTIRVTIDQPNGVGMEVLTRITRAVSRAMDDEDPLPGRYTLEVSSPGLERPLRTADHFIRAVGQRVKVKTAVEIDGQRRFEGALVDASEEQILVRMSPGQDPVAIPVEAVSKARTVFEWGPGPKPGSPEARKLAKEKKEEQKRLAAEATDAEAPESESGESESSDSDATGEEFKGGEPTPALKGSDGE